MAEPLVTDELWGRRSLCSLLRLAFGRLADFATRVQNGLESTDWQTQRDIIRAVAKRIEIGPDHVQVVS